MNQYSLIGSSYAGKVSKQAELIKDLVSEHEKELMAKDRELMTEEK